MPKQSDTAEKVFLAADQLLSEGRKPTQQTVRDIIGTGSITTINHALNDWWKSLAQRLQRQHQHPALPEPVISAASKLWDQALAYSHAALDEQRQALQVQLENSGAQQSEKIAALQQDISNLQQQNNRLLELNEGLAANKVDLQDEIHSLESKLIAQTASNEQLKRDNKEQDILLSQAQGVPILNKNQADDLFQAKINLKVSEKAAEELTRALANKEQECAQLQQQVLELEKRNLKQVHRLEMVIAQQDMKYSQLQNQLDDD
ncbi:MAG: DNA-binding protein [Pseudomonadales bacterium]